MSSAAVEEYESLQAMAAITQNTRTIADRRWMRRALELARRGWGHVEPNPMVGCVLVQGESVIGEGWHGRYGGPHAEAVALRAAGERARGATCVVTLEPCCHVGQTPPCTQALIAAGVQRVVIGCRDPNPQVEGRGIAALKAAGMDVVVGVRQWECQELIAPFAKRIRMGQPWVVAKWAMTLDGHIATASGASQWITGPAARGHVHRLRGVMDAIVVGIGTVLADDCQLTARPPGPRTATRVVLDRHARLPRDSRLVQTAREIPVLVAVGPDADPGRVEQLQKSGCEVWHHATGESGPMWQDLLFEFGRRDWTQVLVEGGSRLLGTCVDSNSVDEVYAFIAPKVIGGATSPSAVGGEGVRDMSEALTFYHSRQLVFGDDVCVWGRVRKQGDSGKPNRGG